tara:strand:- start:314 stop:1015 length:702 start_codon:yes stop_codon:yes gene_type:complete
MNENFDFDCFLFIGYEKFSISISQNVSLKEVYKKEIKSDNSDKLNLGLLNDFLEDNIFKVEKILNNFLNNTHIILDHSAFFSVEISLKKENYGNIISDESLIYLLNDAKDQCKNSFQNKKIIHMIIDNYLVDDQNFSKKPENLKCRDFSLDIRFICLPEKIIEDLKRILKKYQISLNRIVNANYAKQLSAEQNQNLFEMSSKILNGFNQNEILFKDKIDKNKGFFEKFFNIFG